MSRKPVIKITRILGNLLLVLSILAAILFLPAGSLEWVQAWIFIAILGIFFLLYIYWGIYKDPQQFQERSQISKNVKRWDRIIMGIYAGFLPTVFIVAGFDVVRFGWSEVPVPFQMLAWLGLCAAAALILWTVAANTYLARYVRIQDDRGQKVITTGPYHYVRHPMYLGIMILFLSIGPVLGSCYALIPGAIIDILFIIRTAKEDKTLQEELEGYQDYARQVKYRLIPWIW
jgi:protein-S-isoprenylcysteine O-methyltransferase Ste14